MSGFLSSECVLSVELPLDGGIPTRTSGEPSSGRSVSEPCAKSLPFLDDFIWVYQTY